MFTLFKNWYRRHFSQPGTIEFALVLIAIFIIIYYFMWLVGPLVVAVCLAYVLDWGVCGLINKFKMSRHCASLAVMGAFVAAAVLALVLVVPQIIRQGAQFYDALVSLSSDVISEQTTVDTEHGTVMISDVDSIVARQLHNVIDELPDPIPSMISREDITKALRSMRTAVTVYTANLMRNQLMPSVVNVFTYLMYLVIVPIFAFLLLYNKEIMQQRARIYLLPNNQNLIRQFWPRLSLQIEGYIRGKILHIIIIAIVNTLAFRFFGLNYAVLLGVGVGLSVVIPYVGAVLIGIPVILISVIQFGLSYDLLWLLLTYLIIQLADSNLLTPMLFSKALNLDAFSILAAILIFGGLWGFWGVFFAIPLATFIKTLLLGWPTLDGRLPRLPEPVADQREDQVK